MHILQVKKCCRRLLQLEQSVSELRLVRREEREKEGNQQYLGFMELVVGET